MRRGTIIGLIAAAVAGLGAAPAQASFHEMSIQEIFPGSSLHVGQDYVTLQMWSSGENFVNTQKLRMYDATGAEIGNGATFTSDVANGASQSTILIGAASTVVGVTPDLVDADLAGLDPNGGAVCWATVAVDCASWGSFPQATVLPSPVTKTPTTLNEVDDTEEVFTHQYTQHGCETTLDAVDDTNDMDADFSIGAPVPRNNASAPTEMACFNTQITAGPQGKTRKRRPTFEFASLPADAPTIVCAVDDPDLSGRDTCTSPHQLPKQSLGKHTFYAAALNSQNGIDPSPAARTFKVVKRRH